MCRFEGSELVELELHPVELGFDLPDHQRGIPVLADDDEAAVILDDLDRLSEPFGTSIGRATSTGERLIGRVQLS